YRGPPLIREFLLNFRLFLSELSNKIQSNFVSNFSITNKTIVELEVDGGRGKHDLGLLVSKKIIGEVIFFILFLRPLSFWYLKKIIGIKKGDNILDLGCGVVMPPNQFKNDNGGYVALDIDTKTQQINRVIDDKTNYVIGGYAGMLPFKTGTFDLILMFNLPQYDTTEIYRCLKPNGKVIVFWEQSLTVLIYKYKGMKDSEFATSKIKLAVPYIIPWIAILALIGSLIFIPIIWVGMVVVFLIYSSLFIPTYVIAFKPKMSKDDKNEDGGVLSIKEFLQNFRLFLSKLGDKIRILLSIVKKGCLVEQDGLQVFIPLEDIEEKNFDCLAEYLMSTWGMHDLRVYDSKYKLVFYNYIYELLFISEEMYDSENENLGLKTFKNNELNNIAVSIFGDLILSVLLIQWLDQQPEARELTKEDFFNYVFNTFELTTYPIIRANIPEDYTEAGSELFDGKLRNPSQKSFLNGEFEYPFIRAPDKSGIPLNKFRTFEFGDEDMKWTFYSWNTLPRRWVDGLIPEVKCLSVLQKGKEKGKEIVLFPNKNPTQGEELREATLSRDGKTLVIIKNTGIEVLYLKTYEVVMEIRRNNVLSGARLLLNEPGIMKFYKEGRVIRYLKESYDGGKNIKLNPSILKNPNPLGIISKVKNKNMKYEQVNKLYDATAFQRNKNRLFNLNSKVKEESKRVEDTIMDGGTREDIVELLSRSKDEGIINSGEVIDLMYEIDCPSISLNHLYENVKVYLLYKEMINKYIIEKGLSIGWDDILGWRNLWPVDLIKRNLGKEFMWICIGEKPWINQNSHKNYYEAILKDEKLFAYGGIKIEGNYAWLSFRTLDEFADEIRRGDLSGYLFQQRLEGLIENFPQIQEFRIHKKQIVNNIPNNKSIKETLVFYIKKMGFKPVDNYDVEVYKKIIRGGRITKEDVLKILPQESDYLYRKVIRISEESGVEVESLDGGKNRQDNSCHIRGKRVILRYLKAWKDNHKLRLRGYEKAAVVFIFGTLLSFYLLGIPIPRGFLSFWFAAATVTFVSILWNNILWKIIVEKAVKKRIEKVFRGEEDNNESQVEIFSHKDSNTVFVGISEEIVKALKERGPDNLLEKVGAEEYLDFYKMSFYRWLNFKTHIIVPKYKKEDIWRDPSFKMRREIFAHIDGLNKELILDILSLPNRLVIGEGTTDEDIRMVLLENSQREFEKQTELYLAGRELYVGSENELSSMDYSHIKLFAYIYAEEINEVLEVLKERPKEIISILDIGVGFGNLFFTILSMVPESDKHRIRFVGIDYKDTDMKLAQEYAEKNGINSITFALGNVEEDDWKDQMLKLNNNEPYNIVISNHVLEHLDTAISTEAHILNWSEIVKDMVTVAVPIEDEETGEISEHTVHFTEDKVAELAKTINNMTENEIGYRCKSLNEGILVLRKQKYSLAIEKEYTVLSSAKENFGEDVVTKLVEIYWKVWGEDCHRKRFSNVKGRVVSVKKVLMTLNDLYENEYLMKGIVREIAVGLQYTEGMANLKGYMRLFDSEDVSEIAYSWLKVYKNFVKEVVNSDDIKIFRDIWVEYATALSYRQRAMKLTGNYDVDSFAGMKNSGADGEPAFLEYEKADFVRLKSVNQFMRTTQKDIEAIILKGDMDSLVGKAVMAKLYGEGRFWQMLRVYLLGNFSDEFFAEFYKTVDVYINNIEKTYKKIVLVNEIDKNAIIEQTKKLNAMSKQSKINEGFKINRHMLFNLQAEVRLAESYLEYVERMYYRSKNLVNYKFNSKYKHPVKIYKDAGISFLKDLEQVYKGEMELSKTLEGYRNKLIYARVSSDEYYGNDFYFWNGYGENPIQMRVRSNHPRVKLYSMEAYAERMYYSAKKMQEEYIEEGGVLNNARYEYHFNKEAAVFIQEWITFYSARRAHIFGLESLSEAQENKEIINQDKLVREIISELIAKGGDQRLWGWLYSGYTDRLRQIIVNGRLEKEDIHEKVQSLSPEDFEDYIQGINPYGSELEDGTPSVVVLFSMHNVDPKVADESLVHAKELDWPFEKKWVLIGTSTNDIGISEKERELALENGAVWYHLEARRHLKPGTQNRIIPNTVMFTKEETMCLVLDDDYLVSSQMFNRGVPIMLNNPEVPFIQAPLYFRANNEYGCSRVRIIDAAMIQQFGTLIMPACENLDNNGNNNILNKSNKKSPFLMPLGTNTIFRLTQGRNMLEDTGCFPVDRSAEDFTLGAVALLRKRTSLFTANNNEWSYGMLLNEVWVRGDSVDYFGKLMQMIRWSEGGTQVFFIWMKGIFNSFVKKRSLGTITI
ncbi:MAG: methyltransferase domain-containing protein, partial [Candidatus Omnitrophica bacterium]|nr:methyltransferase domain-containing protein [Candidatus Omnitrophota bacterium]